MRGARAVARVSAGLDCLVKRVARLLIVKKNHISVMLASGMDAKYGQTREIFDRSPPPYERGLICNGAAHIFRQGDVTAAAGPGSAMAKNFFVTYEGVESSVSTALTTAAWLLERKICGSCGIPWGSVFQLVDGEGTVYAIDVHSVPEGAHLLVDVAATSSARRPSLSPGASARRFPSVSDAPLRFRRSDRHVRDRADHQRRRCAPGHRPCPPAACPRWRSVNRRLSADRPGPGGRGAGVQNPAGGGRGSRQVVVCPGAQGRGVRHCLYPCVSPARRLRPLPVPGRGVTIVCYCCCCGDNSDEGVRDHGDDSADESGADFGSVLGCRG